MNNKKGTKHALLSSALALLLCVSMLIGSTFAWFTDSVVSGKNTIVAGNLDIELEYSHDGENWKTVNGSSELFDKEALWEPGYTHVVYLRLSNLGSLALRYDLGINIISETTGINVNGKSFRLSNYINMAVIERAENDVAFADRDAARDMAVSQLDGELELVSSAIANGYNVAGSMTADADEKYLALVVYMPETVGNEANYKTGTTAPQIELGVRLVATQYTAEEDSFGFDYDADAAPVLNATYAWYEEGLTSGVFTINTASDLAGLANIVNGTAATTYAARAALQDSFKGKTITLAADIDLMNAVWAPIGNATYAFEGTFDGNGKTISNLFIPGYNSNVGLFGFTTTGEVKNLTVENAKVSGYLNVGVVAGTPYTTKYNDITVKGHVEVLGFAYVGGVGGKNAYTNWNNITVNVDETSYVKANSVENTSAYRTYVGGVIGFMGEGGHTISNVTSNIDVYGTTCDVGGIVGIAHYGNVFENVTCTGNVYITNASEIADAEEMGGIAGVWHNATGYKVTFNNCAFTGELNANIEGVNLSDNKINGAPYSKTGTGTLVIDGKEIKAVISAEDVKAALANNATVYLLAGEYTLPSLVNYEGVTIIGGEGAVIGGENVSTGFGGNFGKNTTIKNVTFAGSSNGVRYSYAKGGTTTFENCTFAGDSTYGFHIDQSNGATFIFNDCTFVGFNAFAGDLAKVTFNNCTFLSNGNYGHTNIWSIGEFNNCTWGENTSYGTRGDGVIYVNGVREVASQDALNSAVTAGDKVNIALGDGNYSLPSVSDGDVTISGTKDTVITVNKPAFHGTDVTLNGVTIKGNGYSTGIQHVDTVTYNDVTIIGEMCLYGEKVVFNNCAFELNGQYIWTYGAKEVEFNNCTFNTTGKAILIYNEGAGSSKVTVKGCTFNATAGAKAGAIANQNCAAIEIDNFQSSGTGAAHVLITEGNTYSDNFSGEWRIKNFVSGNPITVNGAEYTQIAIDGKLMTIDGNKNVTVLN